MIIWQFFEILPDTNDLYHKFYLHVVILEDNFVRHLTVKNSPNSNASKFFVTQVILSPHAEGFFQGAVVNIQQSYFPARALTASIAPGMGSIFENTPGISS